MSIMEKASVGRRMRVAPGGNSETNSGWLPHKLSSGGNSCCACEMGKAVRASGQVGGRVAGGSSEAGRSDGRTFRCGSQAQTCYYEYVITT